MDATRARESFSLQHTTGIEYESPIEHEMLIDEHLEHDPAITPLRELRRGTVVTVLAQVLSAQRTTYTITDGTALAELVSHTPLIPGRVYRMIADVQTPTTLVLDELDTP